LNNEEYTPHRNIHFPMNIQIWRLVKSTTVPVEIQHDTSLDQEIDPEGTTTPRTDRLVTSTLQDKTKHSLSHMHITLAPPINQIRTTRTLEANRHST